MHNKDTNIKVTTEIIKKQLDNWERGLPYETKFFFEGNVEFRAPNITFQYTKEEYEEIIKCANDVVYFAERYCYVLTDEGYQKIVLREYQKNILKNFQKNRFNILLASRQIGKTTTSAIFICWYLLFNHDKNVLVIANKFETTQEIVQKIIEIIIRLPYFLKPGIIQKNQRRLKFDNGCRLITQATTKTSAIGFTIHLLYADEFAHIHPNFLIPFYRSVFPTLSSSKISRMIITSTANGMNLFYQLWDGAVKGENSFNPIKVDWWEVPGRDEKWKETQIKDLGSVELFEQEYGNKFISASDSLLSYSYIKKMERYTNFTSPFLPVFEYFESELDIDKKFIQNLKWFKNFNPLEKFNLSDRFVLSIDLSAGIGKDYSVINIFKLDFASKKRIQKNKKFVNDKDFVCLKQVGIFHDNTINLEDLSKLVAFLYKNIFYTKTQNNEREFLSVVLFEYNFQGEYFLNKLIDFGVNPDSIIKTQHNKESQRFNYGVRTNNQNKMIASANIKQKLENDVVIIRDKNTLKELEAFGRDEKGRVCGLGMNDDIAMSVLLLHFFFESKAFDEQCELVFEHSNSNIVKIIDNKISKNEENQNDDFKKEDFDFLRWLNDGN